PQDDRRCRARSRGPGPRRGVGGPGHRRPRPRPEPEPEPEPGAGHRPRPQRRERPKQLPGPGHGYPLRRGDVAGRDPVRPVPGGLPHLHGGRPRARTRDGGPGHGAGQGHRRRARGCAAVSGPASTGRAVRRCIALVLALGLTTVAGCAAGGGASGEQLTVFVAASLAAPFGEIAEQFEEAHPGVEVRLSFDGSSGLVDQLAGGAPADVFASADQITMDRAVREGLVTGEPRDFATNVLTLITPPGNPAGVTGRAHSPDGARLGGGAAGGPAAR